MGSGSKEDVPEFTDGRNSVGSAQMKMKEAEAAVEGGVEPHVPAIVYYIFYLLGMGTLLPWNFFITADSYWSYKFRNASADGSNSTGGSTDLQYSFTAYLSVASMVPNTIFLTLNAVFADKVKQQLKLLVALSVVILLFVVTTILVPVNSDAWQNEFFAITMVVVVLLNIGSAVFQGGLFGLAAQFPSKYLSAVMSGQALGAVFACVCRIISIAVAGEDAAAAAVNSALVYFLLADVTLLISFVSYLWMSRQPFYKFYTSLYGPEKGGSVVDGAGSVVATPQVRPNLSVWAIFLKIKWYALSVCLVFLVTLSMFPAVTAKIRPVYAADTVWGRDYFVQVCCFLLFNATDYIGRVLGGYTIWPKRHQWYFLLLLVLARLAFAPLFMYCNLDPENTHLPTVFNSDAYYIVYMVLFGLSNGYLATLAMIYGPGVVDSEEQNMASSMMAAFLGLGLCLGAFLSNAAILVL